MELITKKDGSNVTIEITGWLDTQTAPQLGEELAKLDDSVTSLVFDFDKLEYISSAGLRQVISAYKKMSGKDGFKIINVLLRKACRFYMLPEYFCDHFHFLA